MSLPRSVSAVGSFTAIALSTACGGGGSGGADPHITPTSYSTVVYDRDNTDLGTDLYRTPIDGSSLPVGLTRHRDSTRVRDTWPEIVKDRIVYVAEKTGSLDFYSAAINPPPGSGPAFTKLSDTALGTTNRANWQIVGDRIVVKTTRNGVDNLFAVAVDHAEIQPLTLFNEGTILWPRDPRRQSNAVSKDGLVLFQHQTTAGSTVYCVAADGSLSTPRQLSTGPESSIAIDTFGRPMVSGNTVVVREFRPLDTTTQFRAADATRNDATVPLTTQLLATEEVTDTGILGGRFLYVTRNTTGGIASAFENVFSVSLLAPLGSNGQPQPTNLTNFTQTSGAEITEISGVEGDDLLAVVAEFPTSLSGAYAEAFSVKLNDPQTLKRLTRQAQPPMVNDEIVDLVRCGQFLVFGRTATPNAVWQVQLGLEASEAEILPGQPTSYEVGVEREVSPNRRVDPIRQVILSEPATEVVEHVILYVTTDNGFSNYYSATPSGNVLRIDRLSNQQLPASDVLQVKGSSIV